MGILNPLGELFFAIGFIHFGILGVWALRSANRRSEVSRIQKISTRLAQVQLVALTACLSAFLQFGTDLTFGFIFVMSVALFTHCGICTTCVIFAWAVKRAVLALRSELRKQRSLHPDPETISPPVHEFEFLEWSGQKDGVW